MLANVDIYGQAVACSRFMGGREFEIICKQLGSNVSDVFDATDVQNVIDANLFALPNFSDGSGPFPHAKAKFIGYTAPHSGAAIATLYCALMIDYQLDLLATDADIIIEGSFLKNTLLCSLVAQLRKNQSVKLSADTAGTVQGCAMLTQWDNNKTAIALSDCLPANFSGLAAYRDQWKKFAESQN